MKLSKKLAPEIKQTKNKFIVVKVKKWVLLALNISFLKFYISTEID
jgi:hypothetical protein